MNINAFLNQQRPRRNRRWVYITAALVVLGIIVLMPKAQTVRLALVIAQENPVQMSLTVPQGCVLDKVYLAGSGTLPRSGKLFTLKINEHEYEVSDFDQLVPIKTDDSSDKIDTRLTRVDWNVFKGVKTFNVSYSNVDPAIERYALELVFEVAGDPETVKKWHEFVQLKSAENTPLDRMLESSSSGKSKQ